MGLRHAAVLFAIASSLLAAPAGADDEAEGQLRALLERRAPAVVFVKAVIKTETLNEGQTEVQEDRAEMVGVMVDP